MGSYIKWRYIEPDPLLCDTILPSSITVNRPVDTPNNLWNNENLRSGLLLSNDVNFKFTIGSHTGNTASMVGLDFSNDNDSYNTIDYAVYLYKSGNSRWLRVYENGSFKGTIKNPWNTGDVVEIKKVNNIVTYHVNNILLYTSTNISNNNLEVNSSFYYANGFWGSGSISLNSISYCQI